MLVAYSNGYVSREVWACEWAAALFVFYQGGDWGVCEAFADVKGWLLPMSV